MIEAVRCNRVVLRTLFSFILWYSSTSTALAQIRHGASRPVAAGLDQNSDKIQPSIDFFEDMPAFDIDSALFTYSLQSNRNEGIKFAQTLYTDISPENAGISYTSTDSKRIWKVGIRSNGAYSINLFFKRFILPDNAQLFLYTPDQSTIYGPFTNKNQTPSGEFMVAPMTGDEIIVEYQEPLNASFHAKIQLSEVKHDYLGLTNRSSPRFNSISLPCIPDVSCNGKLDTIKQSTCLLIINGDTYCTGTFVNNTAQDGKPYLLTAAHCLEDNWNHGNRVLAFLNYESPKCDTRIRGSEEFSMSGSICRALNTDLDIALIEFFEKPPADYRLYLSGWNRQTNDSLNAPFTCIHHPNGEPRKYSLAENPPVFLDGEPENNHSDEHWYISHWTTGHTWAGSSGSGLFDASGMLIGTLSTGGSGGLFGCGAYNTGDYFSRFDRCWDSDSDSSKQLKHWLDPLTVNGSASVIKKLEGFFPDSINTARRISNITVNDSISRIPVKNGTGSMFGHNSFQTKRYAEFFECSDSSLLLGTYIMVAKGKNTIDKPVYVEVFEYDRGIPGKLLSRELLHPTTAVYNDGAVEPKTKTYFTNRENYHRFATPIPVGKRFFVGYELSYPLRTASDSFQVYGALRSTSINTAFFQKERAWYPFYMHTFYLMNTSIWIDPVIMKDTSSSVLVARDTVLSRITQPSIFWSRIYSTLEISFPRIWVGKTQLELLDMTGKTVYSTNVDPPRASLVLKDITPRVYVIRLRNRNNRSIQKIVVGYD